MKMANASNKCAGYEMSPIPPSIISTRRNPIMQNYEMYHLLGHSTRVKCICINPTEKYYVSSSAKVWRVILDSKFHPSWRGVTRQKVRMDVRTAAHFPFTFSPPDLACFSGNEMFPHSGWGTNSRTISFLF